ncbi:MAG: biosynthetic peptidoglycan transglycosylase [Yoonia sp.]|uniref:biosynthetic peptidoglycan transglycosylase n=1 Tax=Yoonia sp. TaxID=2212373 RepID=UPI003EF94FB3
MKVSRDSNLVRQDWSLKRSLVRLNRDLEKVVRRIDQKEYDQIWFRHSHRQHLTELSNVQKAILFLEDRRFFVHRGFEFRAFARILKRLVMAKQAGAISTLDQQLVRIYTDRYERTLRRKLRETLLAFLLNSHRSKARILNAYIHDSYLGYRLEGCEIASMFLFSKPAILLTESESCFIAALLARPLPKLVFEQVALERQFRLITPELVIKMGDLQRLNWARRIDDRYQYALRMFPSIPNSLRIR